MTIAKLVLMLVCLMSVTLEPKDTKVTPLLSKDLTDFPGKEGLMITVEYPPGGSDPIHKCLINAVIGQVPHYLLVRMKLFSLHFFKACFCQLLKSS